ncbi:MAG: HTH domain-containing protein [Chloroflexi bacterium]|nr:HTH domain-containing protein [Chloroflexota bacterium]
MRNVHWSAPTSNTEAYRRAGGRRHYNAWRRFMAVDRQRLVAQLALEEGFGFFQRGAQARLAKRLGVSRSTICRDVEALLDATRAGRPCPCCGHLVLVLPSERAQTELDLAELLRIVRKI